MEHKAPDTQAIISALSSVTPYKIILFGSHAQGRATDESDLDLIVVLNEEHPFQSFRERMETTARIRTLLRPFSLQYGLDLLVFTLSEWETVRKTENTFWQEIRNTGVEVV